MEPKIQINIQTFLDQFLKDTQSHLSILRNIIHSINDSSYKEKGADSKHGNFLRVRIPIISDDMAAIQEKACNNCFANIIRSFLDYLDKLIAILELPATLQIKKNLSGEKEILDYINHQIEDGILNVAINKKLKNPHKISKLLTDEQLKKVILAYFQIRNDIEHHKSIAEKNVTLEYCIITTFIKRNNGKEEDVKTVSIYLLNDGEKIMYRLEYPKRLIQARDKIFITEEEIEQVYITLTKIIIPKILKGFSSKE